MKKSKIAESIGVHPSTVSRELKRNRLCMKYCAQAANLLKAMRKRSARKYTHSYERPSKIIPDGLLIGWSPKKLSLGMKHEVLELALSHTTIYRRIAMDKANGRVLHKRLQQRYLPAYPNCYSELSKRIP